MTQRHSRRILLVGSFLASIAAHAHHSYSEYDDTKTVEVEGKLVEITWQNPHARIVVEAIGAEGRVSWNVESAGLNNLRRLQVPFEIFKVGDNVKVAGWPSKRSGERMFGTNMLSADGQELVLWRLSKARWATTAFGYGSENAFFRTGVATESETVFRTWVTDFADPDAAPQSLFGRTRLTLTEAARKTAAEFNPIEDTTTAGCTPKGMPAIMSQPFPIEFVDRQDTIQLRIEEYDTLRTIHMSGSASAAAPPKTPLGYSTGRWEGKTLIVDTNRVSEPYLTNSGVPLGPSAEFVERFTPSSDGSRLNYTLTVTDRDSLAAPAELKRSWVWRPGEQVMPFNCAAQTAAR